MLGARQQPRLFQLSSGHSLPQAPGGTAGDCHPVLAAPARRHRVGSEGRVSVCLAGLDDTGYWALEGSRSKVMGLAGLWCGPPLIAPRASECGQVLGVGRVGRRCSRPGCRGGRPHPHSKAAVGVSSQRHRTPSPRRPLAGSRSHSQGAAGCRAGEPPPHPTGGRRQKWGSGEAIADKNKGKE